MNEACSRGLLDEYLSNDDVVYDATQIFDALSDLTRFRILGALSLGEKSVSDLEEICAVSQSAYRTSYGCCATEGW